jgi:hypothetical protein
MPLLPWSMMRSQRGSSTMEVALILALAVSILGAVVLFALQASR